MDPFSALSVAAGVVQFVDFGSKLIFRAIEIHSSDDGLPAAYVDMAELNSKMSAINEKLEESLQATPRQSLKPHEQELLDLCKQCHSISAQLGSALRAIQKSTKPTTWDSLGASFRSIMGQHKIKSLQVKLDAFRQQLVLNILVSLRCHVIENPLDAKVQDPKSDDMVGLGTAFLQRIDERERWQTELIRTIVKTHAQNPDSDDIASQSSRIAEAHASSGRQSFASQLLSRLRFSSINDREYRIPKAFEQTYEWMFDDASINKGGRRWSSYREWLNNQTGLYWITGKPGAGKSTLMKFIFRDRRTAEHLQVWSSGSQLLRGSFFFWNSGKEIQMSKDGLLRSLLFDVLQDCRIFIPTLFPAKWEAFSLFGRTVEDKWAWNELEYALKQLLEIGRAQNMKFCFFIDGLDEFDGSSPDLIELFQELVSNKSHMKACVSSRPWNVFEDAFKASPGLSLDGFTNKDIIHFVTAKLENSGGFREMQVRDPGFAARLIADIVTKSSGVFLWVDLVMCSLLKGLTEGDHIEELQRRVDQLPDDLESLFKAMLDGVQRQNPAYFVSACKLLQVVGVALEPLTLICIYFADEDTTNPGFSDTVRVGPLTDSERWSRAATMKRRLNSRTKGLLEVDRFSNPLYNEYEPQSQYLPELQVQYLHRTVRDYFRKDEVWKWVSSATGPSFMPHYTLCNAFRLLLKTSDPLYLEQGTFLHHISVCFKYASILEHDRKILDVAVLERIDHTAKQVINNTSLEQGTFAQYMSTMNYHWSSAVSGARAYSSFLAFAVRFRLDSYVTFRLEETALDPTELSAMLHAAVVDFDNLPSFGPYVLPNQGKRNIELITELLKRGASPYEHYGGPSAYEAVDDDYYTSRNESRRLLWLFSRYGRRLNSSMQTAKGCGGSLTPEQVHASWSFRDDLVPTRKRPGYAYSVYEASLQDRNTRNIKDRIKDRLPWHRK